MNIKSFLSHIVNILKLIFFLISRLFYLFNLIHTASSSPILSSGTPNAFVIFLLIYEHIIINSKFRGGLQAPTFGSDSPILPITITMFGRKFLIQQEHICQGVANSWSIGLVPSVCIFISQSHISKMSLTHSERLGVSDP